MTNETNRNTGVLYIPHNCHHRVYWARAGLGLPLTDKQQLPVDPPTHTPTPPRSTTPAGQSPYERVTPVASDTQLAKPVHPVQPTVQSSGTGYSQPKVYSRTSEPGGSSQPGSHVVNMSSDHDKDKYKRRPAFNFLSAWFKSHDSDGKSGTSTQKRFFAVLVLGVVGFLTILVIFSRLSQGSGDELEQEMMDNLNIRVADKVGSM